MNPHYVFGCRDFEISAKGLVKFEMMSSLGRFLTPHRLAPQHSLLHLGCGMNKQADFDNLDFYTKHGLMNALLRKQAQPTVFGHDLRYPLPFDDGAYEGIFSEHALEHLGAGAAINLLNEMRRVLKPGGTLRLVVPDLEQYVDFYNGQSRNPAFASFKNGCEAIWNLTENWCHLSCWDEKMLGVQLLDAGFKAVRKVDFRAGSEPRLFIDQEHRRWESLYLEATA
jgi:SAM-dependent methyltransferase